VKANRDVWGWLRIVEDGIVQRFLAWARLLPHTDIELRVELDGLARIRCACGATTLKPLRRDLEANVLKYA